MQGFIVLRTLYIRCVNRYLPTTLLEEKCRLCRQFVAILGAAGLDYLKNSWWVRLFISPARRGSPPSIFEHFRYKQEIRSVELGVCSMQLFHFWSRDVHPVQNLLHKISSKSDDFSLRYGDISISKMASVRHLGIVLPPYETTHEVSVAGRSRLSNLMSIWYTDLKI